MFAGLALVLLISGCATHAPKPSAPASGASQDRSYADFGAQNGNFKDLQSFYGEWEGTPYEYGGESRSGVDCSSFVQQALDKAGLSDLPRTTEAQAEAGKRIDRAELEQGDLVFFNTGGEGHVGIYVGDDQFIHASTSQGVTTSHMDAPYWRRNYWQSRRVN